MWRDCVLLCWMFVWRFQIRNIAIVENTIQTTIQTMTENSFRECHSRKWYNVRMQPLHVKVRVNAGKWLCWDINKNLTILIATVILSIYKMLYLLSLSKWNINTAEHLWASEWVNTILRMDGWVGQYHLTFMGGQVGQYHP